MIMIKESRGIYNFILIPLYIAFYTSTLVFLSLSNLSFWGYFIATGIFMLHILMPTLLLVLIGYIFSLFNNRIVSYILWVLLGILAGYLLAEDMNTFVRLDGEYSSLAWIALVCQLSLGIGLALLCASLQRHNSVSDVNKAVWGSMSMTPIKKLVITLFMIGIAIACHVMDFFYLVDLYPNFHHAMRFSFVIIITWVCIFTQITDKIPKLFSPTSWLFMLYALGVMITSCTLTVKDVDTIVYLQTRKLFDYSISQLRTYTDWDGDYYSSWFAGGDCAPWNPQIYPGAKEIPNNNIDDNCHAGDLKLTTPKKNIQNLKHQTLKPKNKSSIVLITIDTLRADHMSVYGYHRDTTPNLKQWSQEASVFTRAYSASAWTSLAISSLMTGLYPSKIKWN